MKSDEDENKNKTERNCRCALRPRNSWRERVLEGQKSTSAVKSVECGERNSADLKCSR
jgi:hypothetical protein